MSARSRRPRPPLDEPKLNELALRYVGRFATSRAKLSSYLRRKLRERGWDGAGEPPVETVVDRCVRNGFVDDAAFAMAKARSLSNRGYGAARLRQSLRAAGIDVEESDPARQLAHDEAVASALRFARRKSIGPYAGADGDRAAREKAVAALLRAGHPYGLARKIADLPPGGDVDIDELREQLGRDLP